MPFMLAAMEAMRSTSSGLILAKDSAAALAISGLNDMPGGMPACLAMADSWSARSQTQGREACESEKADLKETCGGSEGPKWWSGHSQQLVCKESRGNKSFCLVRADSCSTADR